MLLNFVDKSANNFSVDTHQKWIHADALMDGPLELLWDEKQLYRNGATPLSWYAKKEEEEKKTAVGFNE